MNWLVGKFVKVVKFDGRTILVHGRVVEVCKTGIRLVNQDTPSVTIHVDSLIGCYVYEVGESSVGDSDE